MSTYTIKYVLSLQKKLSRFASCVRWLDCEQSKFQINIYVMKELIQKVPKTSAVHRLTTCRSWKPEKLLWHSDLAKASVIYVFSLHY